MSVKSPEFDDDHPKDGMYVVMEPKSRWRWVTHIFHFHGAPIDAQWNALAIVREQGGEGYNVRRAEDEADAIAARTSSFWPIHRLRWYCLEWKGEKE